MRCMERVTWKLTLPYEKQIANWDFLYGSGNSNKGLDGLEDRREVQKEGDICIPMADSCWGLTEKTTEFYNTIILQLKKN